MLSIDAVIVGSPVGTAAIRLGVCTDAKGGWAKRVTVASHPASPVALGGGSASDKGRTVTLPLCGSIAATLGGVRVTVRPALDAAVGIRMPSRSAFWGRCVGLCSASAAAAVDGTDSSGGSIGEVATVWTGSGMDAVTIGSATAGAVATRVGLVSPQSAKAVCAGSKSAFASSAFAASSTAADLSPISLWDRARAK